MNTVNTLMGILNLFKNEKGFVFVVSMMLLGILIILATTGYYMTRSEQYTSRNFLVSKMAFYDAEAGIQYVREMVETDLKGCGPGVFSLPSNIDDIVSFPYSTPSGNNFKISNIRKTGPNEYEFKSTGFSHKENSLPFSRGKAEITVTMKRTGGMNYAVFGNTEVKIKSAMDIFSYNSADSLAPPLPNPYDAITFDKSLSTGRADIASNGTITVKQNSYIDGDIHVYYVSADNNADAFTSDPKNKTLHIQGNTNLEHDRINPDPFNISGITDFSSNSDAIMVTSHYNASNELTLNASQNYFNSDLVVENNQKIIIDTGSSGNNFHTYFEGIVEFKAGSTLEIIGDGHLTIHHTKGDFRIKNGCNFIQPPSVEFDSTRLIILSSSTDKIELMHSGTFTGLIYSPDASLQIHYSKGLYGAIWSNTAFLQVDDVIFYDTGLAEKYPGNEIVFTSWFNHRLE
ncbi:MAG: hypothetical protein K9L30_02745 [Desulfobacterales bacterium]|nr:hypothetical protein [Desulfobacterales bacterium]